MRLCSVRVRARDRARARIEIPSFAKLFNEARNLGSGTGPVSGPDSNGTKSHMALSMEIEPLGLAHQSLLKARFEKLNLFLSEYSFANLYLFRHLHRYELLKWEQDYFIRGKTRDQKTFIMLTSPPNQLSQEAFHSILPCAEFLYPIPNQWLPLLEKETLEASFKDEDSDYLYEISKFLTYPGNKLNAKRNLVRQLLKSHQVRAEPLTPLLTKEALPILDRWQEKHLQTSTEETDYHACREAIHHLKELNLHGRLVYVDHRPLGLIIGEWMAPHCYAVHFCKGAGEVIGLYQYLYQDLALSLKEEGWLNLEQDLGILNLRQTKHSYQPDQLLPKWRLKLRQSG